jgi:glycosyltransferase involved in cell wall biosynthesis
MIIDILIIGKKLKNMRELVSVIIGTYERFDLLQRAIESVLSQSYNNIELIVVDDCSKDYRYKKLENNKKFKFIKLPINSGLPAVPRNVGINNSNGTWISFLDDDDFFLNDKIEKQMNYSDKYDFICSDAFYDQNLKIPYAKGLYLDYWNRINITNTDDLDMEIISKHNLIINSSVLIKKDLLFKVGLITENKIHRRTEDYHTWLKVLTKVKYCKFVESPLLYYNMYSEKK